MDVTVASGVLTLFVFAVGLKQFPRWLIELNLKVGRSISTAVLLGLVAYAFSIGYVYTSLALTIVAIYYLKDMWTSWTRSDARRLYLETGRDQSRFDTNNSIDLQFASGKVTHDRPVLLGVDTDVRPLLLFPPSQETLRSMNGE